MENLPGVAATWDALGSGSILGRVSGGKALEGLNVPLSSSGILSSQVVAICETF